MSEEKLRLSVIIGSAREGRSGLAIARWFIDEATSFAQFDVDILDLAAVELPMTLTKKSTPEWAEMHAEISCRLEGADAFVVITPEYNHSFTAPLKNLIDWHPTQWQAKPVAFVSYGGLSGGLRAVEQLRQVFAELHATTIRDTVSFHAVWNQLDQEGKLRTSEAAVPAKIMLERLMWWAAALRDARSRRPFSV